jgi:hypothetical protein
MMYWKLMLIFAIAVVTGCGNYLGPQVPCSLDENKEWICNTPAPRPDGDQAARTVAPARLPYGVDVRVPSGSRGLKRS